MDNPNEMQEQFEQLNIQYQNPDEYQQEEEEEYQQYQEETKDEPS